MTVRVGAMAPEIDAEAYVRNEQGPQRITPEDYAGRWTVLFFYPRDFTFVCPTEIAEFARLHEAFVAEGAVLIGASTDSYFVHKAWYETDGRLLDVTFPVIADTSHALSETFGVLQENGAALRATFLIDPEGRLVHMTVNEHDVGRNIEDTLRTLIGFKTRLLCPAGWSPGASHITVEVVSAGVPELAHA